METKLSVVKSSILHKEFMVPALVLLLIVLGGLYARINGLAELGLGFDETIHIYAAKSILETGEATHPSGVVYDRALPFTYSVALFFKLFGISELSARLPSVIFGTLSIVLLFFVGKRFFGTPVGIIAAFLLAFLPFEIVWSRTCRMYAMYQFFFLFGFYAFYEGFENKGDGETNSKLSNNSLLDRIPILSSWNLNLVWLFFSAIVLYLAFSVHRQAAIFYGSVISYLFCMSVIDLVTKGFRQTLRAKYFLSLCVLLLVGIVVLVTPNSFSSVKNLSDFSPSWAKNMQVSPTAHFNFLISPDLFPIMAFFVLGAIQVCTRVNKAGFYTLMSVAVPLFLHSFLVSVQRPRYIYDIFPLILLISAYSIYNLFESELRRFYFLLDEKFNKHRLIKKLSPALLAFLFLVCFLSISPGFRRAVQISNYQAERFGGEYNAQWKEACAYVKGSYRPGDITIASIPLNADFYGCGNIEYSLDNGEIDQFIKSKGSRFQLHPFADTKAIVNLQDLKQVLSENPHGWLVLDGQRFQNPSTVPEDVREFITENLVRHATEADGTIFIFSWGNGQPNSIN